MDYQQGTGALEMEEDLLTSFEDATMDQLQRLLNVVNNSTGDYNWDWLLSWTDSEENYRWATVEFVLGILETIDDAIRDGHIQTTATATEHSKHRTVEP
jgi:hypothetical protein